MCKKTSLSKLVLRSVAYDRIYIESHFYLWKETEIHLTNLKGFLLNVPEVIKGLAYLLCRMLINGKMKFPH